jgi:hypothetical protein
MNWQANPRPRSELREEMHDELYHAVYTGDRTSALRVLDEIAMVEGDSDLGRRIRSAKRCSKQ